jgi:hypothetical protein
MSVVSAPQYGFMEGIAHGSIPPRGSLTRAKAEEFVNATPPEKRKQFSRANARKRKYRRMARSLG